MAFTSSKCSFNCMNCENRYVYHVNHSKYHGLCSTCAELHRNSTNLLCGQCKSNIKIMFFNLSQTCTRCKQYGTFCKDCDSKICEKCFGFPSNCPECYKKLADFVLDTPCQSYLLRLVKNPRVCKGMQGFKEFASLENKLQELSTQVKGVPDDIQLQIINEVPSQIDKSQYVESIPANLPQNPECPLLAKPIPEKKNLPLQKKRSKLIPITLFLLFTITSSIFYYYFSSDTQLT